MAATYNYLLSNFLATPNPDDVRLRIYEKTGKLRYTIDPNISYFFTKSNIVIINVEDRNSIQLDFPNSSEAAQALAKLNQAKKVKRRVKAKASITIITESNMMSCISVITPPKILKVLFVLSICPRVWNWLVNKIATMA